MTSATDIARPWIANYPRGVPAEIDLPNCSLPELIADSVRKWPDHTALIFYGSRWTYRSFWEATGRFATALDREGFSAGDRIALSLPNCPAYPIAFFGALRLGLTVIQLSPLYVGQDLDRVLRDSEPKGIVTLEILHGQLRGSSLGPNVPVQIVARLRNFYPLPIRWFVNRAVRRRGLPTEFPTGPKIRPWSEVMRTPDAPPTVAIEPARSVAVFQYTGGTTGRPKAAMLTHRNLVANTLQCRAWFTIGPPGTGSTLASIPFFHVYGMTVALNLPLAHGAAVILQTRPDVDEILKLIQRYRPTEFPGVPALYQALSRHPNVQRFDLRSIRVCVSGSAPLPREVSREFSRITGAQVLEGYGLSEASPVTHANPVEGERREGSIGIPLPSTDQELRDPETGTRAVPHGERGELWVRGPQVMLGYYRQPEESRSTLRDGWLATGDIATIDAQGYAYIVDRKKDLIDVGGFKVYPREVEEVLFQQPAIQDAAVVGVPDSTLGEVVRAFVVLKSGATLSEPEVIDFVRARIAHYKAPRSVVFRSELPRNAVQKVLRRVLRESAPSTGPPSRPGLEAPGDQVA